MRSAKKCKHCTKDCKQYEFATVVYCRKFIQKISVKKELLDDEQ